MKIHKFPEEKPLNNQTVFVCNHFYDHWWFGCYDEKKKGFYILNRNDLGDDHEEFIEHVTRWIPMKRPCFMFDQEDGKISDYICDKCHREHKDCKERRCNEEIVDVVISTKTVRK